MQKIEVRIKGVSPILQHRFGAVVLETLMQGSNKKTGATDYSLEYLETMYANADGLLYQPATHLEGSMIRAAASFKIKGARGKTYKDSFKGYVYVTPDEIPLIWKDAYILAPDETLITNPTDCLSVSVMRVVVQRSAVARSRVQVAAGWELAFGIEIHDEQLRSEVVEEILKEAGRAVGIGDFRPRYGRFEVTEFRIVGENLWRGLTWYGDVGLCWAMHGSVR